MGLQLEASSRAALDAQRQLASEQHDERMALNLKWQAKLDQVTTDARDRLLSTEAGKLLLDLLFRFENGITILTVLSCGHSHREAANSPASHVAAAKAVAVLLCLVFDVEFNPTQRGACAWMSESRTGSQKYLILSNSGRFVFLKVYPTGAWTILIKI